MKRKHIDAARELRLWIGTVIIPLVAILVSRPDILSNATTFIKTKFRKPNNVVQGNF